MYPTNHSNPTKSVTFLRAGQGETAQVQVTRDTTIEQVLLQMGLVPSECDVAHPSGERLVALDEKPWDLVQSSYDSIMVAPSAQVGRC
jgi:hypothetical protein